MATFKKISFKALKQTTVKSFCESVAEAGAITINKVIDLGDKKEKANITHIMGSNFLDVNVGDKNYPRIGFDLFTKAILTAEIDDNVEIVPEAIDDLEIAFEGKLGQAYSRQKNNLAKNKAKSDE